MTQDTVPSLFAPVDTFVRRHIGPDESDVVEMLAFVDAPNLEALVDQAMPSSIRMVEKFELETLPARPLGETETLARIRKIADRNVVMRSLIGLGYHGCIVPPVVLRNVLENPGWYTQYTPYQAEISQGRLEALLNFQTMIADLTGLPMANASLLDEATAAAEAMHMSHAALRGKRSVYFVSDRCHPQTLSVVRTRAEAVGIEIEEGDAESVDFTRGDIFGLLLQYPASDGQVLDYAPLVARAHASKVLVTVAADLLSLVLLRPPGEFGADICIGSAQRFGVPMGYGGPHAAFLSTREDHKRTLPGRIIGTSRDRRGKLAYRMAMQTREQHIRRQKATSNICTAQVLLAIMAGMYGVYHGPAGLRAIASRVYGLTKTLAAGIRALGHSVDSGLVFDTLRVRVSSGDADAMLVRARSSGINLRLLDAQHVGISLDERSDLDEVTRLLKVFSSRGQNVPSVESLAAAVDLQVPQEHRRTTAFLTHPTFNRYHAEHEMLRYLTRLQNRDLSLTTSMISLGSCTMKLNAVSEMIPITWPEFSDMHPFAPIEQAQGYRELFDNLESWLCTITGFSAVSLQPNAGSQGEFSGLLTIRAFHRHRGEENRNVCLIPISAHGTNPASAVMAGMKVVVVACDSKGNIDIEDLRAKAEKHKDNLAAMMVTYPSTHGVFEARIREMCSIVHEFGGQVYLDGANMNAQVGHCRPGDYGADVCHLNLHKTFAIPHGGGGPGVGPIGVVKHLAPFLPGHALVDNRANGPVVAAAPWGSAGVLPISWMYIALMGARGLQRATSLAILNANYMAKRLGDAYPVLYCGEHGRVAHEFIVDLRPFERSAGVLAEDVAKRLMDFGFHAPTMSFPVPGTLMIEPTESESRRELDRFCEAMLAIRAEIQAIEDGALDREDNPLKFAPHPSEAVVATDWPHGYSREQAAYPLPWVRENKFWPHVARIDNAWGDRHLHCTCPAVESFVESDA